MAGEEAFKRAYENLARCTSNFREVSNETLIRALNHDPGTFSMPMAFRTTGPAPVLPERS